MELKITNTDGSTIYSDDVIKVTVSAANKITEVIYGATTVAAIPAYNGANTKYEVGLLTQEGKMHTWLSN